MGICKFLWIEGGRGRTYVGAAALVQLVGEDEGVGGGGRGGVGGGGGGSHGLGECMERVRLG